MLVLLDEWCICNLEWQDAILKYFPRLHVTVSVHDIESFNKLGSSIMLVNSESFL